MILRIGSSGTFSKTVTEGDIDAFAKVSGDFNRVHMDNDYALQTVFGGRIAHGMLTASFASAALANEMPGPGCVLIEMSIKFLSPVHIGDTVATTATVSEIRNPKRIWVDLVCSVDRREAALGRALVVPPEGIDVEV